MLGFFPAVDLTAAICLLQVQIAYLFICWSVFWSFLLCANFWAFSLLLREYLINKPSHRSWSARPLRLMMQKRDEVKFRIRWTCCGDGDMSEMDSIENRVSWGVVYKSCTCSTVQRCVSQCWRNSYLWTSHVQHINFSLCSARNLENAFRSWSFTLRWTCRAGWQNICLLRARCAVQLCPLIQILNDIRWGTAHFISLGMLSICSDIRTLLKLIPVHLRFLQAVCSWALRSSMEVIFPIGCWCHH